jgi:hypothetical protein
MWFHCMYIGSRIDLIDAKKVESCRLSNSQLLGEYKRYNC